MATFGYGSFAEYVGISEEDFRLDRVVTELGTLLNNLIEGPGVWDAGTKRDLTDGESVGVDGTFPTDGTFEGAVTLGGKTYLVFNTWVLFSKLRLYSTELLENLDWT